MQRACIGTLLGLELRGERLSLTPRLPKHWPGFEIALRLAGQAFILRFGEPPAAAGEAAATHRLGVGEWMDWRRLPQGAVVQVRR